MNRIQFWTLIGLSVLVGVFLLLEVMLVRMDNAEKNRLAQAQQVIQQGEALQGNLKQLAMRIAQDSQKTQNQNLKDLLARNQITITSQPAPTNDTTSAPPAPTH